MSKRKKKNEKMDVGPHLDEPEIVYTKVDLGDDKEIVFQTNDTETLAVCEDPVYIKRVAHRNPEEETAKEHHERVTPLFDQYVEDVKRCL